MTAQGAVGADGLRRVLAAALAMVQAARQGAAEAVAETALTYVLELIPADRATFFVVDALTGESVSMAWKERKPPEPARFGPGAGAVGWAVANRAPLLISDARRDPRFQPIRPATPRALLTVPLESGGEVVAAISCVSFGADVFQPTHVEILQLFGPHVAAALALCQGQPPAEARAVPAQALAEYAHEVRGPLHTALGYLALAEQDPGTRAAEAVAMARQACQQALQVSDAVLDAAAEEHHGLVSVPQSRPLEVGSLLRAAVERAALAAERRGVRVEVSLPQRPATIAGRHYALERLLDNLLLNAVDHSPQGGVVLARLEVQPDRLVLAVEDQGPGIPEADLERVFAPFYRAGSVRRERSSGLGLSLARRWASQLGGRLWAENRATGGSRFVLQLPLLNGGSLVGQVSQDPEPED